MSTTEADMMYKASQGDAAAFGELVRRHQGFVYALSYRLLGHRDDALDMTQEVFLRLWKHLPRYRAEIKLTTWLYTITTNVCLDHMKSRRYRQQRQLASLDESITQPDTPEAQLMGQEFKVIITQLSAQLTPMQKAVFVLRDVEELSVDEVCTVLQVDAVQVKSNLYYARKKVARLVEEYYREKNKVL